MVVERRALAGCSGRGLASSWVGEWGQGVRTQICWPAEGLLCSLILGKRNTVRRTARIPTLRVAVVTFQRETGSDSSGPERPSAKPDRPSIALSLIRFISPTGRYSASREEASRKIHHHRLGLERKEKRGAIKEEIQGQGLFSASRRRHILRPPILLSVFSSPLPLLQRLAAGCFCTVLSAPVQSSSSHLLTHPRSSAVGYAGPFPKPCPNLSCCLFSCQLADS